MSALLDAIFPKYCAYCGLVNKDYLCLDCVCTLEQYKPECFITRNQSQNWQIFPSKRNTTPFEKVYYFYKYDRVIHDLVTSIKYGFHKDMISELKRLLLIAPEFTKLKNTDFDLITYVPISKKRERWRGFNQTRLFAEKVAEHFQLPFCQITIKAKDTKPQIDLDREERLTNIQNSFVIKNNLPVQIEDQRILLIDDICTTGSTLTECAKVIKEHFPRSTVYGFCLARGE